MRAVLPFYHVVSDEPLPHIQHLYPVRTVPQFTSDMEFLARKYRFLSLIEVFEHVRNRGFLPENTAFLSFDDGLRQCAEIIAPILVRMGIPATFFINSDFIDNQALMFRYAYSLEQSGIEPAAFLRDYRPYMSSQQLHDLVQQGFSLGGHSVTHPRYASLPLSAQLVETLDCQQQLQAFIGTKTPQAFAFPFTADGISHTFFTEIQQHAHAPELFFGTSGMKRDVIPNLLHRLPMEKSRASAAMILGKAYTKYLIQHYTGTSYVHRPEA